MSVKKECPTCGNPVDSDGLSTMNTRWCHFICEDCHGYESHQEKEQDND